MSKYIKYLNEAKKTKPKISNWDEIINVIKEKTKKEILRYEMPYIVEIGEKDAIEEVQHILKVHTGPMVDKISRYIEDQIESKLEEMAKDLLKELKK